MRSGKSKVAMKLVLAALALGTGTAILGGTPKENAGAAAKIERKPIMTIDARWPIDAAAFSPDGQMLAVLGGSGLEVYDVGTGKLLHLTPVRGHFLQFSPDGKRLACVWAQADHMGNCTGQVTVVDPRTGKSLFTTKGITANFSLDSSLVAVQVAFSPALLKPEWAPVSICDATSGNQVLFLPSAGSVLTFAPDGKKLLAGGNLWDLTTGKQLATLPKGWTRSTPLAWTRGAISAYGRGEQLLASPDSRQVLFISSSQATIKDATTKQKICGLSLPARSRFALAPVFCEMRKEIFGATFDPQKKVTTLRVWDRQTGKEVRKVKELALDPKVSMFAFSPTASHFCTIDSAVVTIWIAKTGQKLHTLRGHAHHGMVNGVAYSPDGKRLASASSDRTVRIWEVATGRELLVFKGHKFEVNTVAFHPDGKRLASGGRGDLKIWDGTTGREILALGGVESANHLVFSPDGKLLATTNPQATTWDVATGKYLTILQEHPRRFNDVAFSPDGRFLATAMSNGTLRIWDTTGREIRTLGSVDKNRKYRTNQEGVACVAYSPDGKTIAGGYTNGWLILWETQTGKVRLQFRSDRPINCLRFSPGGRRLATGSPEDPALREWDTATGKLIRSCEGNISSLSYHPDGKTLATGSWDGSIKIWKSAGPGK